MRTPVSLSRRAHTTAVALRGFYGWRIAGFAAITLAMTAPGQTVGVSVFVDPMIADLGVSRSEISIAYFVGTLTGAAALPSVGRWIDRAGVRRVMLIIGVAFGAVLVGMAGVRGIVALTAGFVGIRLLGQGSVSLTSTTAVALWFDRFRGLAIGLSNAVGGGLMSLAPILLGVAIARFDWRIAWVLAGVTVWLIVVPIARWGLRNNPAEIGQRLDGTPVTDDTPGADDDATQRGWTRTEAVRTLMFWAVTGAVAASGMITTGLAFHQISLLGERGLTPAQAAANFVPQTAAAITATVAMGVLIDRVAPRLLVAASMGSLAAAMVLAQTAAPGLSAVAFGVAAGAGAGTIRALEAAAFPRYFGLAHIGAIRGLVMAISVGATAFGPLALAFGREWFGGYGQTLTLLLALPLAAALTAMAARAPDDALRRRVRHSLASEPGTITP